VTTSSDRKGRVVIEVRDRGVGIPERQLHRIFHRFHRVDDEKVRRRRGTGLGLFVVAALVRNLGGQVRADSAGPGRGTTMTVTLPAVARVTPASEARGAA
jgi:signal transduction histidine kinase